MRTNAGPLSHIIASKLRMSGKDASKWKYFGGVVRVDRSGIFTRSEAVWFLVLIG